MAPTEAQKSRTLVNPAGTEEFYNTWQFSQGVRVAIRSGPQVRSGSDRMADPAALSKNKRDWRFKTCPECWKKPAVRWRILWIW